MTTGMIVGATLLAIFLPILIGFVALDIYIAKKGHLDIPFTDYYIADSREKRMVYLRIYKYTSGSKRK